jgi:dipeptidyl aminopeptidase/acylaminoacyl peptidase
MRLFHFGPRKNIFGNAIPVQSLSSNLSHTITSMRPYAWILLIGLSSTAAYSQANELPALQNKQYDLAKQYSPENIDKLAFRLSIQANWIGDHHFWYYRDDPQQGQYILVDPSNLSKTELINLTKLASTLALSTGKPCDPKQLKLQKVSVTQDLKQVSFDYQSKSYQWDRKEESLKETKAIAKKTQKETVSPDGKWQAFIKQGNLYLRDLATGKEHAYTQDGTAEFSYAQTLVNPLLLINGTHKDPTEVIDVMWSPDSKKIATIKMDLRDAATLSLVQSSPPGGGTRPKTFTYPYALSGDEKTARASMLIIDVATKKQTPIQLPAQAVLYYGSPDFRWNKKGDALFSFLPERGYAAINLYKINPQNGKVEIFIQEKHAPFADYYGHRFHIMDEHNEIYWTSDRSGWKHLERYDASTGKQLNALTQGPWRAADLLKVDHAKKQAFIVGLGREANRDPYLRHLYRVNKDGSDLTLLTPEALDHEVSISPNFRYVVDNMSSVNTPTRTVVRDAQSGKILMELEQADISALLATGFSLPQPFQSLAADGKTAIYGVLYKPVNYNRQHSYPIIDNIYTGPHTTLAPKSMARALKTVALPFTALDFSVVYVDGRGTNRRDRAFLNHSYKNLGNNGYDDHEVAIRTIAKQVPGLDINKVGIFGFSAGGYDTARAMFTRPDFYKVGWAASGNHDHRSDKAVWNEQWMGALPLGSEYDRDSNLTVAKNLKGKLMIAHGELDSNVNPMASMQLINALILANKNFDMLWIPNAEHFLDDYPYYNHRRWDYFIEHLQGRKPIDRMNQVTTK